MKDLDNDPEGVVRLGALIQRDLLRTAKTNINLLSTSQKDIYQFFEAAKRGGFSVINERHLKANIPDREGYNDKEDPSWLLYLNANNLYGM